MKDLPGYYGHSSAQENVGNNSGCTYGVWGVTKWVQVLRKDGVEDPTCDAVDEDTNRRRVCACKPQSQYDSKKQVMVDDIIGATRCVLDASDAPVAV